MPSNHAPAVAAAAAFRRLSREDIVETVGAAQALDELEDLEILFLSFSEIASLELTPRLRKLTLIDNGLTSISNLTPVGLTLTTLTLCDQELTCIAGLSQCPNLRELYLHRNMIASMEGLTGCARLRKLWLFQNRLTSLAALHSLPELQELWVQANAIRSLDGLVHCHSLHTLGTHSRNQHSVSNTHANTTPLRLHPNLTQPPPYPLPSAPSLAHTGLAGNPLSDFSELSKLAPLPSLRCLSLSDIHFGRCPVADDDGYRAFVVTTLVQVRVAFSWRCCAFVSYLPRVRLHKTHLYNTPHSSLPT